MSEEETGLCHRPIGHAEHDGGGRRLHKSIFIDKIVHETSAWRCRSSFCCTPWRRSAKHQTHHILHRLPISRRSSYFPRSSALRPPSSPSFVPALHFGALKSAATSDKVPGASNGARSLKIASACQAGPALQTLRSGKKSAALHLYDITPKKRTFCFYTNRVSWQTTSQRLLA